MATLATFDDKTYGKLLAREVPKVIRTAEENERYIAILERLDTRGRPLTAEEREFAELLTLLIRQFEESAYPIGRAKPVDALRSLMEDRGLRQKDLIPIFGSSSVASDVVNGKRGISKTQARKLGEYFHVPVELFI